VAVQRAQHARRLRRSQHFLRSTRVAAELVTLARVASQDLTLEIGAGDGIITAELGRRAGYVIAHELDSALARSLRRRFGPNSRVLVVEGDAFRQPLPGLPFRVVSNVPFDSTTRLLRYLLDDPGTPLERAALVLQWEVARKRAREHPPTLLGLSWAPWWELSLVRQLPAAAFSPAPSVDAGIVVVEKREPPLLAGSEAKPFRSFLRTCFKSGIGHVVSARERRRLGFQGRQVEEWIAVYEFAKSRRRI
jgi:23S rRNA (adenine-N6)-dimethyltransferase